LISLALGGITEILERLKTKDTEFIVTPTVKKEAIERAMMVKKYKLEAIRISALIEKGVIKNSSDFVSDEELQKETERIRSFAKNIMSAKQEKIELIHGGEASCLAFSKMSNKDCLIVVDERTTRMISESPEELKKLMEKKLHVKLTLNKKELDFFKNFKFIRSSELVFLALKKDLMSLPKNKENLDALLYNLKFHGTAISSREIEEMKSLL
jgi:predicted nucleic acid-binding protein